MNKAQKAIAVFLIISLIVIAALYAISIKEPVGSRECNITAYKISANNTLNLSNAVLYYGVTCPHCKIVEEFMKNNSIESKINMTQKEVFENKTNAYELIALGEACKVPSNAIGAVPMMYSNNTCYLGDKDIICILKQKVLGENA